MPVKLWVSFPLSVAGKSSLFSFAVASWLPKPICLDIIPDMKNQEHYDEEEMLIASLPLMALVGIVLGVVLGLWIRANTTPESSRHPEKTENRSYCNPSGAALWILSQMP